MSFPDLASPIIKYTGAALKALTGVMPGAVIPMLSMAEVLFGVLHAQLANDIGNFKCELLRREKAKTDQQVAEAKRKLAEAALVANRSADRHFQEKQRELELEKQRLDNAKSQAEIDVLRTDAHSRQVQAMAEGQARLLEAFSKLRQEGGDAFFSEENLKAIIASATNPPLLVSASASGESLPSQPPAAM